jgi:hypothetical protein
MIIPPSDVPMPRSGCGPLPASISQSPPPIDVLLQSKTQVQFERTVDSLSKPIIFVFRGLNHAFSTCYLSVAIFAVGRGLWVDFPIPQLPIY